MANNITDIEREVYRARFADGLWDGFIGIMMMGLGLIPLLESWGVHRFFGYLWFCILPVVLFYAGKRFLSRRVVGYVKYFPTRPGKKRLAEVLAGLGALLALALVYFTYTGQFPGRLAAAGNNWGMAFLSGVVFLIVFCAQGYLADYRRLYLVGLLMATSVTLAEGFSDRGEALWIGAATYGGSGLLIAVLGIVSFRRFITSHSIPETADE